MLFEEMCREMKSAIHNLIQHNFAVKAAESVQKEQEKVGIGELSIPAKA